MSPLAKGSRISSPPESPRGRELADAGRAVTATLELESALSVIVREATSLVGAETAAVALLVPDSEHLHVAAADGPLKIEEGTLVPLAGTLTGQVVRSGTAVISEDVSADPRANREAHRPGATAILPLHTGETALGALVVSRAAGDAAFSPYDLERLETLAAFAAIAIENARLHRRVENALTEARQRVDALSALVGTANRLHVELDLPALLVEICDAIVETLGWQCVILSVRDERTGGILLATAGFDAEQERTIFNEPSTPVEEMVRLFKEENRISNSYLFPATEAEALRGEYALIPSPVSYDPAPGEWHPEDMILIPVVLRGETVGVMSPDAPRGRKRPTLEMIQAMELFASQAATAIGNARLFQKERLQSKRMRAQADELEHAYAELRRSQEQLLVSEKMAALGRLTAGIAHEINSPLGGVLNAVELARGYVTEYRASIGDPDVGAEDHRAIAGDLERSLELAESAARKASEFVRTIKGQTRSDPGEALHFRGAPEVEALMVVLRHELGGRGIRLVTELDRDLEMVGQPGQFALLVQNLVSNAADAYEGASGEVRVRLFADDRGSVLEVADRGCGIPEHLRPRIFDYLFTTKEVGKGTGLGLSLVHSIVSGWGGRIEVESEPGAGTLFRVILPAIGG